MIDDMRRRNMWRAISRGCKKNAGRGMWHAEGCRAQREKLDLIMPYILIVHLQKEARL